MNICDCCKRFASCPITPQPDDALSCIHVDPITRADLAARDAEIEALRDEVRLTNEHEHAIMVELSTARDEIADLKRGGVDAAELDAIYDAIRCIGNKAYHASTGPVVPDALWDIRGRAYDVCARIDGIRTIPADRVLGDGMVQVRLEWLRDALALLMDFDNAPAPVTTSKRLYALLSAPDALVPNNRVNQGGLNHVHV